MYNQALEFKKRETYAILEALIRKQNMRQVHNTLVIEFQVKLLSLILYDSDIRSSSSTANNEKYSWLKALKNLITESDLALKEFPLDWLNRGISGYYDLELSQKLMPLFSLSNENSF
ncbi:hypothetical protein QL285_066173 [Trifolium repens]|nr:hypothetical protein QL285_066173 [Trifolium repens]